MKKILSVLIFLYAITTVRAQYVHDSLKVDTGYIHYYTKGKGEPVVLLQGGPGLSSYYMRGISDSLTNYKSILIDYQGTGRSQYREADSSWVTRTQMIHDVELVRKHLGIDKWTLIGNSYGSHFALHYAISYPEHTSRVILTASPGTNNQFLDYYGDNIRMRYSEKDIEILNELYQSGKQGSIERMQISFKPYFYDQGKVVELFDPPEEEIPYFYNQTFFNAAIANPTFQSWDVSEEVYKTDIPIRIIQGRQDPVNGTEVQLNERAKNSKLIYIERAGHFPWVEQPQAFFTALNESLKD